MIIWILCVLTLLLIFFMFFCGYKKWKDKTKIEICPETKEEFMVQNNKDEPEWIGQEVAKRLSELSRRATVIVNHMYTNKYPTEEISERLYKRWYMLRKRKNGFRETAQGETSAAYTVNKHEQIRICLRKNNSFEDFNTAMFVLLHELGHVMSENYDHGIEFRKNFATITKVAVDLGLYNYIDHSKDPTSYCGTDIKSSPI